MVESRNSDFKFIFARNNMPAALCCQAWISVAIAVHFRPADIRNRMSVLLHLAANGHSFFNGLCISPGWVCSDVMLYFALKLVTDPQYRFLGRSGTPDFQGQGPSV